MKDDRLRAFEVLIAVFLIGTILGATGIYIWQKPSEQTPLAPGPKTFPPANGSPPQNMARPQVPEFNMTPEQEEQFGKILKETGEKMQALMNEQHQWEAKWFEKRREIWAENERKVREILNEEQRAKFDPWVEQLRKWRDRPPRRPGPEQRKEAGKKPERL
jgi:hypothetical protein